MPTARGFLGRFIFVVCLCFFCFVWSVVCVFVGFWSFGVIGCVFVGFWLCGVFLGFVWFFLVWGVLVLVGLVWGVFRGWFGVILVGVVWVFLFVLGCVMVSSSSVGVGSSVVSDVEVLAGREVEIRKKYRYVVVGSICREVGGCHAGKITVEIRCGGRGCGGVRRVATSDLFQVRLCEVCTREVRNKRRRAARKASVSSGSGGGVVVSERKVGGGSVCSSRGGEPVVVVRPKLEEVGAARDRSDKNRSVCKERVFVVVCRFGSVFVFRVCF